MPRFLSCLKRSIMKNGVGFLKRMDDNTTNLLIHHIQNVYYKHKKQQEHWVYNFVVI